jgi:hypothetical protein
VYKGKHVILATKHQKEEAIRPIFETGLGCFIHVPMHYDTDQFGTFTNEITRKSSAYETLIQKAKKAAYQFDYHYAIASEGCFGSHPYLYFAPCDTELMAFIDLDNDLIIAEMEISTETNYDHKDITEPDGYHDFLEKVRFPNHALIVSALDSETTWIDKGIRQHKQLKTSIEKAFQYSNTVRLETDMRAMMNPLRMQVIKALAIKLENRVQKHCPQCHTPGFGEITMDGNLTCQSCDTPTRLYQRKVLSCLKCEYKTYQEREDGLKFAAPHNCPYCNP